MLTSPSGMTLHRRCLTLAALIFFVVAPASAFGDQITLVDTTVTHTDTTGAYIYVDTPSGFPADLTGTPDYAGGTVHYRVEVIDTPAMNMTGYQVCLLQTDRMPANHACSDASNVTFDATGSTTATQDFSTFDQIGNLDLSATLSEFALIATDSAGVPVDPGETTWIGYEDYTLYYPLEVKVEAVLVDAAGSFEGFPSDQAMKTEAPTFNPNGGNFTNDVQVTISSGTANADIYYTTDGSDPDMNATQYTDAITLTQTTTLKAIAYASGLDPSDISEATFDVTQQMADNGLRGRYYDSPDLEELLHTRVDPTIEFEWDGGNGPYEDLGGQYSILWTGQVEPLYSETITFKTVNDDGVRLWVNDELIIDDWTDHAPEERTGNISLQSGQTYDVWLEYYNGGGGGTIELWWEGGMTQNQIIPDTALTPDLPARQPRVSLLGGEEEMEIREEESDPVTFQVRRRGDVSSALDISLMVSGTATNGEDFDVPTSVQIPADALAASFDVTMINDEEVEEAEEDVTISLAESGDYTLSDPSSVSFVIADDDVDTYSITGEVTYTGTESGEIFVEAFTEETESFLTRRVSMLDPGPFELVGLEEGRYQVIAYIDSNGNEFLDGEETWATYEHSDGAVRYIDIPPGAQDIVIDLDTPPGEGSDGGEDPADEGCGCGTTSAANAIAPVMVFLLGLLGLRRRRRV